MSQILKITEACTLAFHSMVFLAYSAPKRISTKQIAEAFNVSEAHLSKVLQRLHKSNLVKPVRGPKGGFVLSKPPNKISLLEIYECIDGKLSIDQCLLGSYICGGDICIIGDLFLNMNTQLKKYLSETKISNLTSMCKGVEHNE